MRVALITACYGAFDPVRSLPDGHGFDDAVCVTDDLSVVGDGWRVHVEPSSEHPRLAAKRPKMLPWLFTDCDAAVWLDASFELTGDLSGLARRLLGVEDFVVWGHPEGRLDFVDEAAVCWDWPKYAGFDVRGQVSAYLGEGMPRGWGLFAAGTLGWRFTPEAMALGEEWYGEQLRWSPQDQVSLPYVLWKRGKRFALWPGDEYGNEWVRLRWDERPRPTD